MSNFRSVSFKNDFIEKCNISKQYKASMTTFLAFTVSMKLVSKLIVYNATIYMASQDVKATENRTTMREPTCFAYSINISVAYYALASGTLALCVFIQAPTGCIRIANASKVSICEWEQNFISAVFFNMVITMRIIYA